MNLRQYGQEVYDSYGLVHIMKLKALRDYIHQTSAEQLIKEVREIESAPVLRAIYEAGVPKQVQDAFLQRMNEIM